MRKQPTEAGRVLAAGIAALAGELARPVVVVRMLLDVVVLLQATRTDAGGRGVVTFHRIMPLQSCAMLSVGG